jgi:hypothetical protein
MGTIKSSLPRQKGGWNNPNVEKAPDGTGVSFLKKVGRWLQSCFDDIHETRLRVQAKRRLTEAVPQGFIRGSFYPPSRGIDSYHPKSRAPSSRGGKI